MPCTGVEELRKEMARKEMASRGDSKEMVKAVKDLVAGWGRSAKRLGGWGSNPAKALLASNRMVSERLLSSRCSAWCPVARLGAAW